MNIYSPKNPPTGFYVYAYLRKDSTPYYIGKGSGKRAWARSDRTVFPFPDYSNIIILEQNLTDIGALAIERRMIRWYGRLDNNTGILRNKTDGGDGNAGWIMPVETKEKISKSNAGRLIGYKFNSEQLKNRIGEAHWNYGNTTLKEVSAKISEGVKKANKSRVILVKTYFLIDILDNTETPFDCHNANEVLTPLGINFKSLFWAKRYSVNSIYKNRYTVR